MKPITKPSQSFWQAIIFPVKLNFLLLAFLFCICAVPANAGGGGSVTVPSARHNRYKKHLIKPAHKQIFPGANFSGPPVISYAGPQVYCAYAPITPLVLSNTGGAVPAGFNGLVSTFAGNGRAGSTNEMGTQAEFSIPIGLATDASGNIYVADFGNNMIRKITPAGNATTFAGSGQTGDTDGAAGVASFWGVSALTVDGSGNVYVCDTYNNKIRKITPQGFVSTFAGSGRAFPTDGAALTAGFFYPQGIAVDASGNVYVADTNNNMIRKITPKGVVSTIAGSGSVMDPNGIITPSGLVIVSGNLYVSTGGSIIVISLSNYSVRTLATGFDLGDGLSADTQGNLYLAEQDDSKIKKITLLGVVTTFAGNGTSNDINGIGTIADFHWPAGIAIDGTDNLYVGDTDNNMIRKIDILGYSISPALPPGLTMDATGTISGMPTTASPATNYTITAYNISGSSTATVNITVENICPPTHVHISLTSAFVPPATTGSATVSWTNGGGTGRSVFILQGATTGNPEPMDKPYSTGAATGNFVSEGQIFPTFWYCIYSGTGTNSSVNISGLKLGTNYRVAVVEYTGTILHPQYSVLPAQYQGNTTNITTPNGPLHL